MSGIERDRREVLSPRESALRVLRGLREGGHEAYFAGGCVRDRLMGFEPKDYDIATDARPARVGVLFRHCQFVGEAFGVVIVRLGGCSTEVSTFRADGCYEDGRRPGSVTFTDAENDARRRDFTINGLFEDPLAGDGGQSGRIIDYVGGREDLERGVVRAIGEPRERFGEDYLRMLRAVRFAARLGFEIEAGTMSAIRENASRLGGISRERIGQELGWMLTPGERSDPVIAIRLLQSLQLDGGVLNDEHREDVGYDVVDGLIGAHQKVPKNACELVEVGVDYPVVLGGWVLDRYFFSGEVKGLGGGIAALSGWVSQELDQVVRNWRGALCLSNEHRDKLFRTLRGLSEVLQWETLRESSRKRMLSRAEFGGVLGLLVAIGCSGEFAELSGRIVVEVCKMLETEYAPEPWITGHDLVELGIKPGPAFGRLLDEVYDAQLEGVVVDRAGALGWIENKRRGVS